jgi:hypothetical protein
VVYAHPEADPVAALRAEILRQAIPDPAREARLIDRLLEIGNGGNSPISGKTRLSHAAEWYRNLSADDPRRLVIDTSEDERIPRLALLTYALAGQLTPTFIAQSVARLAATPGKGPESRDLGNDPTFDDLRTLLANADAGRAMLLKRLENPTEVELADLAMDIWSDWLRPLRISGLALVLDQAEELYTTYGSEPIGQLRRYRYGRENVAARASPGGIRALEARDRLFHGMPALCEAGEHFPIRLCISLRPEWYTALRVSLGEFAPSESRSVYILRPLSAAQAASAITEPLGKVRAAIAEDARDSLLADLQSETGVDSIDPFLLGIAARAAWDFAVTDATNPESVLIALQHIRRIEEGPPQVEGSISSANGDGFGIADGALLWKLYDQFGNEDLGAQFTPLEILYALFTNSGSRRVTPIVDLIERPLRVGQHYRDVVHALIEAGLVRRFHIGSDEMIEIRHDRLFAPVTYYRIKLEEAAATAQNGRWRTRPLLDRAIDLLLTYDGNTLAGILRRGIEQSPLPDWAQETLRENEALIAWDPPAARVLLASLLYAGPSRELGRGPTAGQGSTSNQSARSQWQSSILTLIDVASRPMALGAGTPGKSSHAMARGASLSRAQLKEVLRDPERISVDSRASILRSLLLLNAERDEFLVEEIRRWTLSTATGPR